MAQAHSSQKGNFAVREQVINNSWQYLLENYHKFTESNKIRVALALCTKNIPQEVEGMNTQNIMVMGEIKKNDNTLRYNIGEKVNAEQGVS